MNEWMSWMSFFSSSYLPLPARTYLTSHCARSDLIDCYEVNGERSKHNVSLVRRRV